MILVIGRVLVRQENLSQALQLSLKWADQASLQQHFKVAESRVFAKELSALAAEPPSMVIYNATAVGP